jgi:uncharacterized secreted protein with C-terminal beta-propeller domain
VSETNVQVAGIDEPDYIKTDGQEIYYSPQEFLYEIFEVMPEPYPYETPKIKAIDALPLDQMAVDYELENNGQLLLINDILIVLNYQGIFAYDVADPTAITEMWNISYENNTSLVGARLYNGQIYLVTQTYVHPDYPCPIHPLMAEGQEVEIICTDIYYPKAPMPTDAVYNIWRVNPVDGGVEAKTSMTGSVGNSIIYMSMDNLYLTYYEPGDFISFVLDFLIEHQHYFPEWLNDKFAELKDPDLTPEERRTGLINAIEEYFDTLSDDEQTLLMNELMNDYDDYAQEHIREYEKTEIVRIGLDNLDLQATGTIPGRLLNQFSLGESNNHLNVATTIGQNDFIRSTADTVNDVYVLNDQMRIVGSIQDLGIDERIYSARFIGDKGYLVTFREIDPFYVLDLSNPTDPQVKGELKIPGYSAYLHPIEEDKILGVGEEDWRVKISLFDVSDPNNPTEAAKYTLDEYHSDVLYDHHAFLQDQEHEIFFIPGSMASYIFSYANDQLDLLNTYTDMMPRRALFINDYLYIVGDQGIIVVDENTWEKVKVFWFDQ